VAFGKYVPLSSIISLPAQLMKYLETVYAFHVILYGKLIHFKIIVSYFYSTYSGCDPTS